MTEASRRNWWKGLFGKYVLSLVGLVVLVLAVNGGLETWFMYRETTQLLTKAQSEKAESTARRIEQFVSEIERQISWATRASATTIEQHRADYALLLQQVPAIDRVIQLDGAGKEQLRLTRREVVIESGLDYSGNPRFTQAQDRAVWLSPVYFDGLDPFMSIAMPHAGRNAGSTVAEINLKFVSNFIDADQIGQGSDAYVIGPTGRLMARHMVVPIRALQVGAQQIQASEFGHRLAVRTGDEIEDLADHFNRMADQLQGSYGRLEQKVTERTRDLAQSVSELKALEEIGRAVASSLDTKSVLATIVTRAVELTQVDASAIYSYDESRDVFELAEACALDASFQDAVRAIRINSDDSVMGVSAKQREPVCIPDLADAPNYALRDLTLSAGFRSLLVVPLLGQDEILGALVLQRRAAGDFPASAIG